MLFVSGLLLSLVASFAAAQPRAHGGHQKLHEKRDVTWTTVIDYVTTTVNVTTTIYIDAYATSSSSSSVIPTPVTTTSAIAIATTFSTSTTSSQLPAEFHQETPAAAPPPTVSVPPPAQSSTPPPPPPNPPVTVAPPADVPTTTAVAPPVVTTPAPASPPVVAPPASGGASSGGPCSSGSPCSGDITFYEAGLGACGVTSDGTVEKVIALPFGLMGTQSNGNPYCGKTVTITKGTASITAIVLDKCMGCVGDSIDLSHAAWTALGLDYGLGRTQATWFFN